MKSIYLTDEEAIVDFVKVHVELYDKTNKDLKDKQPQPACKGVQDLVRIQKDYGNLSQFKSG